MPHCLLGRYRTTTFRLPVREIVIPVTQVVNIIKGKVKYMLIEIRINDQHQGKLKVKPLNKKTHTCIPLPGYPPPTPNMCITYTAENNLIGWCYVTMP